MSTTLTPSFRRPVAIPVGAAHPEVVNTLQAHDANIVDLNQAIVSIKAQVDNLNTATKTTPIAGVSSSTTSTAAPSTSAASAKSVSSATSTENVTNVTIGGGPVNNQTGNAAYITAQTDNGALIILSDASPIAVTLNSSVTIPFYCTISNQGMTLATVTPGQGTVNGVASLMLQGGGWVTVFFDGLNWWAESPGSVAGSVTQIVAGTGVAVSPTSGVGVVTVSASGGSGGVTQIVAGTNVAISPSGGTGVVTVNATGGSSGSYSLGGTLSSSNVAFGAGAGTGASLISIAGEDGNHKIIIQAGTTPTASGVIFTLTFTASRGRTTYPTFSTGQSVAYSSLGQIPAVNNSSATSYDFYAGGTALTAGVTYIWNFSAP